MSVLIDKARTFATVAHAAVGQVRKYTGEPYINHPVAVARIVKKFGGTESMICAALLHDVVEDTQVSIDLVRAEFGDYIAALVSDLTDVSKPEDGNRAIRKAIDRDHSAAACAEAQTVKIADLIDNGKNIALHDPDFAPVFFREKELLLDILTKANSEIISAAWGVVEDYRAMASRKSVA